MAIAYTENDSATGHCGTGAYCTSGTTAATTEVTRNAAIGSAGSSEFTVTITGQTSNERIVYFEIIPASDVSWDSGTWTVRFNVTTADMSVTVSAIWICRINSSCTNQATIGSATGLSIDCGSTGVKSQTVSGAAQTPSTDDRVMVIIVGDNGAHPDSSIGITPDQNIDSPFTAPSSSFAEGLSSIQHGYVHGVAGISQTLHDIEAGIHA